MATSDQEPNLFELHYDDTDITFSTSSFAGPPQFSYSGPKGDRTFSGDDIASLETALGTEITVTFEVIPDLRTVTLTLILPSIRLAGESDAEFQTFAAFTTTATTIAGPPPGPAQTYELIPLTGAARAVVF